MFNHHEFLRDLKKLYTVDISLVLDINLQGFISNSSVLDIKNVEFLQKLVDPWFAILIDQVYNNLCYGTMVDQMLSRGFNKFVWCNCHSNTYDSNTFFMYPDSYKDKVYNDLLKANKLKAFL